MLTCRSKADAPEIDGNVFLDTWTGDIAPGDILNVEIDDATEYDLWARLA